MRQQGIALITALIVSVVVFAVVAIMTVGTLGDLQQSRSSVQLAQARAVAEAGEVYARYVLAGPGRADIKAVLVPKMNLGANPATQWIIAQSSWAAVSSQLQSTLNGNSAYSSLGSSSLNGLGSASIVYEVKNFRGRTMGATQQSYVADYAVVSTGTAYQGRRRVQDKGILQIEVGRPSLSRWLFLVDDAQGQAGFFPTGTVFNGPVHANKNWGFWGKPEFKDEASTAQSGAWYWKAGSTCTDGLGSPAWINGDSRPPCTVPIFAKGFSRNASNVPLPTSSLSQQRAALGMDPTNTSAPLASDICVAVGLHNPPAKNCNSNPSVPNGVYLVNDGVSIKGGIYIQGNLDQLKLEASGNGKQIYTLKQGSNTWVITVDYAGNQTTIVMPGGSTKTYSGAPNGPAPMGTGGATGQIYVTGAILDLRGPGRSGPLPANPPDHPVPSQIGPALSMETQLNITAINKIGLTSDLVYECDPEMLSDSSYLAAKPRCNTGGSQLPTVLGVMSQNSTVEIEDTPIKAPSDIYLWGSFLAGTPGKGLSVENYGSRGPQGKMRLYGSLVQSADQLRGVINGSGNLTSGYIETFDYDRRFASSTLAPPNFPTVQLFDVQAITPVQLSFREY